MSAEATRRIAEAVRRAGGRALVVGGAVRDELLGMPSKDIDIEVYGLDPDHLAEVITGAGFQADLVGKSFGVLKLKGLAIDVSVPRREVKTAAGHKGFSVELDPSMSVEDAASRRDFTINAISRDPLTGELVDPWGGGRDLMHRLLRHVSSRFAEDPLRVLRGAQFIARFGLKPSTETVALCRSLTRECEALSRERVFGELEKLILKGVFIGDGLRFLHEADWLRHFPELNALRGIPQDPKWHPEGDAFVHTCHCMDYFAKNRIGVPEEDRIVGLAVLCHDLGKATHTQLATEPGGRITSHGHEAASAPLAKVFLDRLTEEATLTSAVLPLVTEHMTPGALYKDRKTVGDSAIRRLAQRVRIDRLIRVSAADQCGRPPLVADLAPEEWLAEEANRLAVLAAKPKPLILGRHLLAEGMSPGKEFKGILDRCMQAQLDGQFLDESTGVEFLRGMLREADAADMGV
jgi:tRNA nucleotidyltransferase (CCA-adding enzyme)